MEVKDAYRLFHEFRQEGKSLPLIAEELGMSMNTLRRWESDRIRENRSKSRAYLEKHKGEIHVDNISIARDLMTIFLRLGFAGIACLALIKIAGFIKAILMTIN